MAIWVGTSGWQYDDWRPAFYPGDLAKSRWLEHYAARFSVVEVNNAFYRLPEAHTFASWAERTPADFVVAVKASRFLTHIKRLREPEEPVARLMERCRGLGSKLGPILLQLPPTLPIDLGSLEATLAAFPTSTRVAVEPRHASWFVEDTAAVLQRFNGALCQVDSPGTRAPRWRTASFGYLRFHSGTGRPRPCYAPRALDAWAAHVAEQYQDADVFAFFNNDPNACAPRDAVRFAGALERHGLRVGRVPSEHETRLASALHALAGSRA